MVVILNTETNTLRISFSGRIVEGPTKIKISSMHEFLSLYNSAKEWWFKSSDNSDDLYASYSGKVKEAFDKIVASRQFDKKPQVKTSFPATIKGSSKVILYNSKDMIKVVPRKRTGEVTSENGICIPNSIRDVIVNDISRFHMTEVRNYSKAVVSLYKSENPNLYNHIYRIAKQCYEEQLKWEGLK